MSEFNFDKVVEKETVKRFGKRIKPNGRIFKMRVLCDKARATIDGEVIFLKGKIIIGTSCSSNTNFVHYADDTCTQTLQGSQVEIIKDIILQGSCEGE